MQGREQTSGDLMALKSQRAFYPQGSAYRSETGGLMEALRVLTAEKSKLLGSPPAEFPLLTFSWVSVREYHRSYYTPHNLCLVVVGRLPSQTLLDVLQNDVEPTILKHGQTGPPSGWKRPCVTCLLPRHVSATDDVRVR